MVKVHSLALNDEKIAVEVIKIGPDNAVPIERIKLRAEGFVVDRLKRAESKEKKVK